MGKTTQTVSKKKKKKNKDAVKKGAGLVNDLVPVYAYALFRNKSARALKPDSREPKKRPRIPRANTISESRFAF